MISDTTERRQIYLKMLLSFVGLILVVIAGVSGGRIVARKVNACKMCKTDQEGSLRCELLQQERAAIDVTDCPNSRLWVGSETLVTDVVGETSEVNIGRTTLQCEYFGASRVVVLNNEKCVSHYYYYYYHNYHYYFIFSTQSGHGIRFNP